MLNYTHIRPRRMAYGGGLIPAVSSNASFLQLFNNSAYAEYLLVREFNYATASAINSVWTVQQGAFANTALTAVPYMGNETLPPGALSYGAVATEISNGIWLRIPNAVQYSWQHNFPMAVVPAGYSWIFQGNAFNAGFTVGVMWEAIKPEQLDEGYYLEQLARLAQNDLP